MKVVQILKEIPRKFLSADSQEVMLPRSLQILERNRNLEFLRLDSILETANENLPEVVVNVLHGHSVP